MSVSVAQSLSGGVERLTFSEARFDAEFKTLGVENLKWYLKRKFPILWQIDKSAFKVEAKAAGRFVARVYKAMRRNAGAHGSAKPALERLEALLEYLKASAKGRDVPYPRAAGLEELRAERDADRDVFAPIRTRRIPPAASHAADPVRSAIDITPVRRRTGSAERADGSVSSRLPVEGGRSRWAREAPAAVPPTSVSLDRAGSDAVAIVDEDAAPRPRTGLVFRLFRRSADPRHARYMPGSTLADQICLAASLITILVFMTAVMERLAGS